MSNISKEALSEVDKILSMLSIIDYIKIPKNIRSFITKNKSEDYIPQIRDDVPLDEQELMPDTEKLCSILFRNYLCSKEEKDILEKEDKIILKRLEDEKRAKYDPNNVFKNNNNVETNTISKSEVLDLVEYKENIFTKIKKFIFKIFHIKN